MKKLLYILLFYPSVLLGQVVLTIEGQTYSTQVNIPHTQPTALTFKNNSIAFSTDASYMLNAGDENVTYGTNNYLDGAVFTGNKLTWTGAIVNNDITPHGLFHGCNINGIIKYNYVDGSPMGIIQKSSTNMVNSSGVISYNIIRNPNCGIPVKGISGIKIYNNTFYTSRTYAQAPRALINVYKNTDSGYNSEAHDTKIYNNIFYTEHETVVIAIGDLDSQTGFDCDNNVYYCVDQADNEPKFEVDGATLDWSEWRALGYDSHSIIINPNFNNTTALVPSARLDYGRNLTTTNNVGLSTTAVWGTIDPAKTTQNGSWQCGARIYGITGNPPPDAAFTANVTSITVGQTVTFTDQSTGTPYAWYWQFEDSPTSTLQNPTHTFNHVGLFTVSLRVTNAYGVDTETKIDYIEVTPIAGDTYYLSPTGSDGTGDGSISKPWFTFEKAWDVLIPGDVLYLRGGTYLLPNSQILTGLDGTSGDHISILAYSNEKPVISKASGFTYGTFCGVYFEGDYFDWKGITFSGFTQVSSGQIWNTMIIQNANHNNFEQLTFKNSMIGLDLNENSTDNLILNCDFHHNYDPLSGDSYGNADGANAHTSIGTTNTFRGCRFYYNSDDGLDFYNGDGLLIVDKCWSWMNGYRENKVTLGGDGYGFKGGVTATDQGTSHLRTVTNSIAFHNAQGGFGQNAARCIFWIYNNVTYHNNDGDGYHLAYSYDSYGGTPYPHIIRNNIAYQNQNSGGLEYAFSANTVHDHNTWNGVVTLTSADFLSLDSTGVSGARQSDGSLPQLNFLRLAAGSDLIDAGIDVGIDYSAPAPDMGAFEYTGTILPLPVLTTISTTNITASTAKSGGIISSGSGIIARGVCWSTSPNPTTSNYYTMDGTGTGTFTSQITGLASGVTYYVRAYAINSTGTAYGNTLSFTSSIGGVLIKHLGRFIIINGKLLRIQ